MEMSTENTNKPPVEEAPEPEFGEFEGEVLNAEWQRPEAHSVPPSVPVVQHHERFPDESEIEAFLKMIYLNQE
jgi:hypothetical protein